MNEFVLRGGRLIDPGQGLDGTFDVHVRDGRVAAIARPGAAAGGVVHAVDGAIVTPGLVAADREVDCGAPLMSWTA